MGPAWAALAVERIAGKEGSRETSKHTKRRGRGNGDAAESPERGASHPSSAAIPGGRRLGLLCSPARQQARGWALVFFWFDLHWLGELLASL